MFAPAVYRVAFTSARLSYNHTVIVLATIGAATRPRDGACQTVHLRRVNARDNLNHDIFSSKERLEDRMTCNLLTFSPRIPRRKHVLLARHEHRSPNEFAALKRTEARLELF